MGPKTSAAATGKELAYGADADRTGDTYSLSPEDW